MTQSVERFCSVRCHAFGSSSTVDQRKLLRNLFYPDLFPCPKNSSASVQELQQRPVPLILTSVQQLTMCFWRKSSINKPPRPNGVKINDVNSKYLTPGFRSKREVGVAYTKLNAYSFIRTLHINIPRPPEVSARSVQGCANSLSDTGDSFQRSPLYHWRHSFSPLEKLDN